MDSVLEQFRAGHEEVDRLKRAAVNELARPATTVSKRYSCSHFVILPPPSNFLHLSLV